MKISSPRLTSVRFRLDHVVNVIGLLAALGVAAWLADRLMAGREFDALATVVLIAVVVSIIARPRFGFLFWIAIAPFSRIFVLRMGAGVPDLGLYRIAILSTLFVIIVQVAIGQRRLARATAVDWAAVLFVLSMALSVPASHLGIVGGAQFLFDFVVMPLLVYFCARQLLRGPQGIQQVAVVLAIVGALLGFFTVREQFTNQPFLSPVAQRWAYGPDIWRITSFFGGPAIMSLTLVVTVPTVLVAATRPGPPVQRLLWGVALLMSLAGILQCYVRAGWLAVSLAILVVILLTPAARRHSLGLALVAVVLIAIFGGQWLNSRALENRLSAEGSIEFRKEAAQAGFQIAARSPILGLGLDNFGEGAAETDWAFGRSVGVRLGSWPVAPHNLYIYVLISAGLVGLIPFLLLLGSIGWLGLRGWQRARRAPGGDQGRWAALLATLVAYAVFSYTFDAISAQLASMLLFLVVGAVLAPQETSPLGAEA